jgi:16S rRNA (cytosine967-C5)-methyltransferase
LKRLHTNADARKLALNVLDSLESGHSTLDRALDAVGEKNPACSGRDRALLNILVYGVLRWRNRLDWIINHFSKTRMDKINPKILNLLRIGTFQIIYLDRVPDSAAVNTSVEIAKSFSNPWTTRYVNALLRNVARHFDEVPFPEYEKDPVCALSVNASFPEWLVQRWVDRLGRQETKALCEAINKIPPITVRTNTLKTDHESLLQSLQEKTEKMQQTDYAPDGVSFYNPVAPLHKLDPFEKGWFQVQDEAAQLVSMVLSPEPGDTVLDACAGMGGKTGHIAQLMNNSGTIVAMDNNPEKLELLKAEMARLGITIVSTVVHDLSDPIEIIRDRLYDRVLLDSPCSGLGVLRRNPDAKWSGSAKKIETHKKIQRRFLDTLSKAVKPSGILVYAVCSVEAEENEEVVKDFLNSHPNFDIVSDPNWLSEKIRLLIDQEGFLRTFPHRHNMDGFFAVCLKRTT